jgi:hypothetical protein
MDPKILALIGIAGLIAGTLIPLAPAMGAENSRAPTNTPAVERPLGALQIKSTTPDKAPPVRLRCDQSTLWYGELCQPIVKI